MLVRTKFIQFYEPFLNFTKGKIAVAIVKHEFSVRSEEIGYQLTQTERQKEKEKRERESNTKGSPPPKALSPPPPRA